MNYTGIDIDENLKSQIDSRFSSGRIPHALIIEGADENKRRQFASFYAKALLCTGDEKPCGKCNSCVKINSGFHSDLKIYEGSGKTATVSIEDIRDMRTDAYIVPNESKYKVYIIYNAHKMNEYAQNALLKCLEEPPPYVVIILECEEKSLLLETVRSRSSSFRLGEKEKNEISEKKKQKAHEVSEKIAKAVVATSEAELMSVLGSLEGDRETLRLCIREVIEILRDAVVFTQTGNRELEISSNKQQAEMLSQNLTVTRIFGMINALNETDEAIDRNANNSLLLTRLCYMLRRCAGR